MMSKTQAQRMQKQQEWREHLRRQETSGQTIADYAKSAGISADALYYWRGRFAREERMKNAPATLTPVRVVDTVRAVAAVRVQRKRPAVPPVFIVTLAPPCGFHRRAAHEYEIVGGKSPLLAAARRGLAV
ncbi:MAG: hypothetical protein M3A44_01485 [Gammaproteobacteria bacterium]